MPLFVLLLLGFAFAYIELRGQSYAKCQGMYTRTTETRNGQPVWIRDDPDDSRFAFYQEGYWAITGTQWMDEILDTEDSQWFGYFVKSTNDVDDFAKTTWEDMEVVIELSGDSYADCQGSYVITAETRNGQLVWIRKDPNDSRFAFYQDGYWAITGTQWMATILDSDDTQWFGYFVRSGNSIGDFAKTMWKDMQVVGLVDTVELRGSCYGDCQGFYEMTTETRNGEPVWKSQHSRGRTFAFYQEGYWAITGTKWMEDILDRDDSHKFRYFARSTNLIDDFTKTTWEAMEVVMQQ